MAAITTRAGKGSPLTHNEVDANFTNLNGDKLDTAGIALGSAASPTIKFTGDLNTGIYSPGADQLAVSTGGTGRLFVDASGRVGIGTSSPNTTLHVYGGDLKVQKGVNVNDISELTFSNLYRTGRILSSYANPASVTETYIAFHTNRTGEANDTVGEAMRIAGGRVGIGTTSPTTALDVSSGTSGTASVVKIQDPAGRVVQIASPGASTEAYIGTTTNHRLDFYTNNTVKATFESNGNVGIGTTSPTTLLDVNANTVRVRTARTPASASATGAIGEICWDASYIYVCTATNTWRRSAISSW